MIKYLKSNLPITLMVTGVLALTACSDESPPPAALGEVLDIPPPPPPPVVAAPGSPVDVNNLQAGMCADDTFEGQLMTAAIIRDCNTEHDFEVAGLIESTDPEGAPFPGIIALRDQGRRDCRAVFQDYTGTSFLQSEFDLEVIIPNPTTWLADGDREIICLVVTVDGEPLISFAGQE